MKCRLEIHPSFLDSCFLELEGSSLSLKTRSRSPKTEDHANDSDWFFENVEANDINRIAQLMQEIIEASRQDGRIILDGVSLICSVETKDGESNFKFRCPESGTRELELVIACFKLLETQTTDQYLTNYLEQLEMYFEFRPPIKKFDEDPFRLRIYGSLSSHESDIVEETFKELQNKDKLLLDLRNLLGMGTILYKSFESLKGIGSLKILANKHSMEHMLNAGFERNVIELIPSPTPTEPRKGALLEIIECHRTTSFGAIMEVKHHLPGLPKGLKLRGTHSGLEWIVENRMVFSPAILLHKRFDCETEVLTKMTMSPLSAITKFKQKITTKEKDGIFQYRLIPADHVSKPHADDTLYIVG